MLGTPLMEWQQYVADVLLELDPDTGELVYTDWTLTVPRQSGKTTLILAKASHRCSATGFFGEDQHIAYMAQTVKKAAEKFEIEYGRAIRRAPRLRARVRTGNQKVDIRYANGSVFSADSTTEKSGHGSVLDEGYIDEAFSQVDNRTEQALEPAMLTRRNRQLGVVSTAGWVDASPYLLAKVKAGRELVAADVRTGTAYFEWSAPDDADPADESVWLDCMPAVHRPDCPDDCSRHTIRLSAIRAVYLKAVRENKLSDFCRAYLNQWKPKPREGEETALGNWIACAVDPEEFTPLGLGLAVSKDQDYGSLGVFGSLADGREFLGAQLRIPLTGADGESVEHLVDEAARIGQEYGIPVGLVNLGPSEGLGARVLVAGAWRLEQKKATEPVRLYEAKLGDYVIACTDLVHQVAARRAGADGKLVPVVVHMNHPELNEAVLGSRWRSVGDGRRVFGRKVSETDVSMLEAVTLARRAATTQTPSAFFGGWR